MLEIASGTGQHIVPFAGALPGLTWQPSDPDPQMRASGRGVLVLYGPFRRFGRHTAPSNEVFDAHLRRTDPEWGVRDLAAVADVAERNGLVLEEAVEMPANNLSVVFRRS